MQQILIRAGVLPILAGSGKNALALLEREQFDIILLDIQMPEMDGFETARRIRQRMPAGAPPIIAMKTETLPPLKNKTRGSLIRAAGKLFARKGFEGTSVREICAEAKTNIAAIKYYFGDKIGLYKEVIEYGIDLGNSLFPLPEKLPEEDYQTFLCKQIEVILQKIKKTSGSKWYEQIIRQEMLLPTKGIQDTIDKKCAEHGQGNRPWAPARSGSSDAGRN